ncbi:hypothetical protein GRI97_08040 [Altererythrobacter xixiisoli]|uniref:Uncharacterized protein n=1 Tax=Croceibacterium xixiisoli TaxID=1476466 RepID=A0A6I4TSM1_9SPHN|nr:hypothetical protein [Croceibacterium xixiisoli]MXO98936.1 hypothetical protein [Croceibacterium xixiisoli]
MIGAVKAWIAPYVGALVAGVFVALLVAFAVQTWRLGRERQDNATLTATIARIENAQKHAADLARLARVEQEARYQTLAQRTDEHAEQAQADAMADARDFIARNRVQCPAAGSAAGSSGARADSDGAPGADRSGAAAQLDAGLIAVPESDILICTENTVRLGKAREWAKQITIVD